MRRTLAAYTLELCWLLLLVVFLALTPQQTFSEAFNWFDIGDDCSDSNGWCIGQLIELP